MERQTWLEFCLSGLFQKTVLSSATVSILTSMPILVVLSGKVDRATNGIGIAIVVGFPVAVIALIVVQPVAGFVWLKIERGLSRIVTKTVARRALAVPLAILVGNLVFIGIANTIWAGHPAKPSLLGGVVAIGTPVAVVVSPLLALWFSKDLSHSSGLGDKNSVRGAP